MKTHIHLLFIFLIILSSCGEYTPKKNDDINTYKQQLISTEWLITEMLDEGQVKTPIFQNFLLTFHADGSILFTNNTTNYIGSWKLTAEETDDDFVVYLSINLEVPNVGEFDLINEVWRVKESSSSIWRLNKEIEEGQVVKSLTLKS